MIKLLWKHSYVASSSKRNTFSLGSSCSVSQDKNWATIRRRRKPSSFIGSHLTWVQRLQQHVQASAILRQFMYSVHDLRIVPTVAGTWEQFSRVFFVEEASITSTWKTDEVCRLVAQVSSDIVCPSEGFLREVHKKKRMVATADGTELIWNVSRKSSWNQNCLVDTHDVFQKFAGNKKPIRQHVVLSI